LQKQPTLKSLQKQPNLAKIGNTGTSNIAKATNPTNNRRIVILPERDNNGDAKHERDNNGGAKHEREQRRSTPMEERMQMMKERRMEKMMTEWRTTNANGERRTQTANANRPQ